MRLTPLTQMRRFWSIGQLRSDTFETTWRTDRAEELMPSLASSAGPTSGRPKNFFQGTRRIKWILEWIVLVIGNFGSPSWRWPVDRSPCICKSTRSFQTLAILREQNFSLQRFTSRIRILKFSALTLGKMVGFPCPEIVQSPQLQALPNAIVHPHIITTRRELDSQRSDGFTLGLYVFSFLAMTP